MREAPELPADSRKRIEEAMFRAEREALDFDRSDPPLTPSPEDYAQLVLIAMAEQYRPLVAETDWEDFCSSWLIPDVIEKTVFAYGSVMTSWEFDLDQKHIRNLKRRLRRQLKRQMREMESSYTLRPQISVKVKGRSRKTPSTGQTLDRFRKEAGWSMDALAQETGMDKRQVVDHIHDKHKPYPSTKVKYAEAFSKRLGKKISPADL